MSSNYHQHSETEMPQVEDHLNLLSAKYLVHCLDTENVCHHITEMDHPPREMKETIFTRHNQTMIPLLANIKKDTLQALHTSFVNTAIDDMMDNRELNGVHRLRFPSFSSHRLQSLDQMVYGPLYPTKRLVAEFLHNDLSLHEFPTISAYTSSNDLSLHEVPTISAYTSSNDLSLQEFQRSQPTRVPTISAYRSSNDLSLHEFQRSQPTRVPTISAYTSSDDLSLHEFQQSQSSNYRAIAISSLLGKFEDNVVFEDQYTYLSTDVLQFGYKIAYYHKTRSDCFFYCLFVPGVYVIKIIIKAC